MIFNLLKNNFTMVFDVGTRDDLSFFEMKESCSYHLFEPNAKFVKSLIRQVKSLESPHIKINNYGLSDHDEDNLIYYEKSQSFIVNPHFRKVEVDTGHRYSLRRLDDYVSRNNISKIDFLKIDAEGMDYKVILGGLDTIKNNKVSYIQFEFGYWANIQKFVDILNNFNLFLMMEPSLLKAIQETIAPSMTSEEKKINYSKSIIPFTDVLIELLDRKIIPSENGGNILGVNKNISTVNIEKLIFDVQ